ncbi:MAG: response regulator transcription factor [Bacteroidetes bacterium]|nr:response regulator transcription factor [Bacteroidota bacterium]
MSGIKIMLIDDHQIVRDGIKVLLESLENVEVIGEASNVAELLEKLKDVQPDIIVTDISMPDISGIELTKIINEDKKYANIKILILSMYTNEDFVFNAIKAGAKGYLPKNTTRKELFEAVNTIYNGDEYFSESISNIILKSYIKKVKSDENGEKKEALSIREIEILKLFAEGMANQEIADKLFISIRTVESHKNHIMQKLALKTTVDLLKFAIKNKIVEI